MMLAIEEANAPPPTPENMAQKTTVRQDTSGLPRAIAIQKHGMARRIEVKYLTLRPPTSGTTKLQRGRGRYGAGVST